MDWGSIGASVGTLVLGMVVGRWNRQNAKDATKATENANAGQLYDRLTTNQGAELTRLSSRLEAVEQDREESKALAREHMKWDWTLVRRLRLALPDEEFPDPPPLDT